MSVLRSDFEAAVHDLLVVCREAGRGHAEAARLVAEPTIAAHLRTLAARRERAADSLAEEVRKRGDIPDAPSGEQNLFHEVVTRAKALVADDERIELLDERIAAERRLLDCAKAAIDTPDAEESGALAQAVRALRDDCAGALEDLADWRRALEKRG